MGIIGVVILNVINGLERRVALNRGIKIFLIFSFLAIASGQAWSQEPIIYPSKGQSQQQMDRDKYDCYSWAKQQTGFDPMHAQAPAHPPSVQPPPGASTGSVVRGGARGAALGAAIGGIAGGWSGAGKGAAIGGLTGGIFGGMRSRARNQQAAQAQQQYAAQQSAQYQQKRDKYKRAYSACLEAKGYVVK